MVAPSAGNQILTETATAEKSRQDAADYLIIGRVGVGGSLGMGVLMVSESLLPGDSWENGLVIAGAIAFSGLAAYSRRRLRAATGPRPVPFNEVIATRMPIEPAA